MEEKNTIEIVYTVNGYDEAGETSFDADVSDSVYESLENAESSGEFLDSDYISENLEGIHKKILKAIRKNMEEESWNSDDGKVDKRMPWGFTYKEDCSGASHEDMLDFAEDDDIEYTISLF